MDISWEKEGTPTTLAPTVPACPPKLYSKRWNNPRPDEGYPTNFTTLCPSVTLNDIFQHRSFSNLLRHPRPSLLPSQFSTHFEHENTNKRGMGMNIFGAATLRRKKRRELFGGWQHVHVSCDCR